MTTVIEQMKADLAYVLSLPEAAESAFFNPKTGAAVPGQIAFNQMGDTETGWSGGTARVVIALLPRETFVSKPNPHETLTRADGSVWIIDSLIGESVNSWLVKAYTEMRPR